jgi:hypothetical protein
VGTMMMENNADDLRKKNQIFAGTYRILMNKSFYLFTIIKVLKIIFIFEQNKAKVDYDTKVTNIDLEDEIFELILKLFYFYTDNNSDNCMIILSSDFAYTFNSIDKSRFERLIDFYVNCLKTLKEKSYKFSTNHTIFNIIKSIIFDILVIKLLIKNDSVKVEKFIDKILKMLKYYLEIPSLDNEKTFKDLRRLLMKIHVNNTVFSEFKNILVKNNQNKKMCKF